MSQAGWSVIIPCWNDARALATLLENLGTLSGYQEIIVADASTGEDCRRLAESAGATVVKCARPNRGAQLNAGARAARGEGLLFQHADTELAQSHLDVLAGVLSDPGVIGGAFHRKYDHRHARLEFLEEVARCLNENGGTLYGDQSIFVRREVFGRMGGFAEIPLMEDLEFSGRLRKAGRTVVLDPPIRSSSRHHDVRGSLRTSLRNAAMIALYKLGFSPQRLHRWYYRRPVFA